MPQLRSACHPTALTGFKRQPGARVLPVLIASGLVVAGIAAEDGKFGPPVIAPGMPGSPGTSTTSPSFAEFTAGRPLLGSGRQVLVQGFLDVDTVQQDNYRDGESSVGDHRGRGLLRSALGLRLRLDEQVSVHLTVGYHAEAGGLPANSPVDGPANGAGTTGNSGTNTGTAIMQEAFVNLQEVLGFETAGLKAGRMPVSFWLHDKRRSFLFDSRADDRDLTSWDGAQASYSGFESFLITPFVYRVPDSSGLTGIVVDWQPVKSSGDDRLFITGSWNLQRDVPVKGLSRRGKSLTSWYAGLDYRQGDVGLWAEFAKQTGQQGDGKRFNGYGGSIGLDLAMGPSSPFNFGIAIDWKSGDGSPGDDRNDALIDPYESISDTYIVEHEKYGEIGRYLDGNLQAGKIKVGVAFDQQDTVRLDFIYAAYKTDKSVNGSSRWLGQEADLTLTWHYNYNTSTKLFGGVYKPGSAFRAIAPGPNNGTATTAPSESSDEFIWLFGANVLVEF